LRWERWSPYKEKYNRLVNVDLRTYADRFEVVTPENTTLASLPGIPPSVLASFAQRGLTSTTADKAGLPSALIPSDNRDFGPRVGLAYRLTNKTSLRAGFGEYFWTFPLSQILQTSRTNPPLNLRYRNPLAGLDGTASYGLRTAPQPNFYVGRAAVDTNGTVLIANTAQSFMPWDFRDWRDDRAYQWNFTIEREILKNTALRLSYIGGRGANLEQRFNINTREAESNYEARTGLTVPAVRDLLRPNPNWNFQAINKTGYSNSHSAQVQLERHYFAGLAFQVFYVFTRSLSTTDAGGSNFGGSNDVNDTSGVAAVPTNSQILGEPNLSYDQRLRLIYANSTAIPPHHIRWNGIYDLPFGKGKRFASNASGLMNALVGGWQIASIGDWRSGTWQSVGPAEYLFGNPSLDADQRLVFTYNGREQRLYFSGDFDPTKASGIPLDALEKLVPVNRANRVLHPVGSAFDNRIPVRLADGTTRLTPITDTISWNSRAFFIGPRAWNVDASVFKNFRLRESLEMRATADFFNAFNHPNDANPNGVTGLQDLSVQTNDPRIIQFSLRLQW